MAFSFQPEKDSKVSLTIILNKICRKQKAKIIKLSNRKYNLVPVLLLLSTLS